MAGGKFVSMDKIRPGAYINFEGEVDTSIRVGTRGIATMIMQLNWGEEGKLTEVTGTDLVDGTSLAKIGLTFLKSPNFKVASLRDFTPTRIFAKSTGI